MNATASLLEEEARAELKSRLIRLRDALTHGLVERDVPVRLALLAALAGEHCLLLGPPGTAKSLIARRLASAFKGARRFEYLLTRFTVPEELFGPLSVKALEEDRYERKVDGYLPTASVAFLDETFKANSAILNALLTLLNERTFDNGGTRRQTPLVSVVGASNELPQGEELDALYDRFLLRVHVGPVSSRGFRGILTGETTAEAPVAEEDRLEVAELEEIQRAARSVRLPDDVVDHLEKARTWTQEQQITVSDRRWRKIVGLLKVAALADGRDAVSVWDLWLLQHCLWDEPEQREAVYDWYAARVGVSGPEDPQRYLRLVASFEGRLQQDKRAKEQAMDEVGRPLYLDPDGKLTLQEQPAQMKRRNALLYLAPPDARRGYQLIADRTNGGKGFTKKELNELLVPGTYQNIQFANWSEARSYLNDPANWLMEPGPRRPHLVPKRYPRAYIDARVAEMERYAAEVDAYLHHLSAHRDAAEATITGHLWVTADLLQPATKTLDQSIATVSELVKRVKKLRDGFASLEVEPDVVPEEAG